MYKKAAVITVVIIVLVTATYFSLGRGSIGPAFFDTLEARAIIGPMDVKIFASAHSIPAMPAEGSLRISPGSIVLGSDEAAMMRKEGLFSRVGDKVKLFGIEADVVGIIEKTDTPLDMMHLISDDNLASLQPGKAVQFRESEGMIKMFLVSEESMWELEEGSLQFDEIERDGKTYYPLAIGRDEAAMMMKERLFTAPGDTIEDFFGNDVFVAGIYKETGGALDMMHVLPVEVI